MCECRCLFYKRQVQNHRRANGQDGIVLEGVDGNAVRLQFQRQRTGLESTVQFQGVKTGIGQMEHAGRNGNAESVERKVFARDKVGELFIIASVIVWTMVMMVSGAGVKNK